MSTMKIKTMAEAVGLGSTGRVDYEQLFRRSQSILMRMLLTNGEIWSVVASDGELLADIKAQAQALEGVTSSTDVNHHAAVLLRCAEKLYEMSGSGWRSDLSRLKVSDFGKDEFIVKYPDLSADINYYFRVLGDDVSPMLIE